MLLNSPFIKFHFLLIHLHWANVGLCPLVIHIPLMTVGVIYVYGEERQPLCILFVCSKGQGKWILYVFLCTSLISGGQQEYAQLRECV